MPELKLALMLLSLAGGPPDDEELVDEPVAAEEADRKPMPTGSGPAYFTYQFAQVQRVEISDGRTRVSVENGQPTPLAGYFPVRVFVDNTSGPRGNLTLTYRGVVQGSHSVTRTVELTEGERRVVTLPAPVEMRYGTVTAKGPGIGQKNAGSVYFTAVSAPNRVLLSLGKPEAFEKFVGKPPSYSGGTVQVVPIPALEAPSELATYVGYDAVVLPELETLELLSEGQRRALESYAASGGTLIVHGPVRAKALFPLAKDLVLPEQRYGFGTLTIAPGAPVRPELLGSKKLAVSPQGPPPEWERRYGGAAWDVLLPQATAPLGRFLLIIGLFTLLIGPGSVWVARKRGPAFLLITIPGTALVTCALIIGYSLIADGFTVHGAVYSYSLLDRASNRTVTVGVTAYYANLAPSSVTFPGNTALVSPWAENRDRFVADIDWRDGARFGSDFVPSRVYREWGLVSVEPTRARLLVKKKGDGWVVQNALGQKLTQVMIQLGDRTWRVKDVPDGAERPLLVDSGLGPPALLGRAEQRFDRSVRTSMVDAPLHDREFLASMTGQGFVPTGGMRLQLHDSDHIVRGEVEE